MSQSLETEADWHADFGDDNDAEFEGFGDDVVETPSTLPQALAPSSLAAPQDQQVFHTYEELLTTT